MKTDIAKTLLPPVSGKGFPETTWVAAALLLVVMLAAVAAGPGFASSLTIGSEVKTVPAVIGSPYYNDQYPAAAFGSTPTGSPGSLVVWQDCKDRSTWNVYGMFVDSSGNPLKGQQSFAISQITGYQRFPGVAYNAGANSFLVVWENYVPASGLYQIHGARVSASSGSVLDSAGFAIGYLNADSASGTSHYYPSVASNGSAWEVTWMLNDSAGNFVSGAHVDSGGNAGSRLLIAATTSDQDYSNVAWNGGNYLVVWDVSEGETAGYDIYGRLLDSTGAIAGSQFAICSYIGDQKGPTVAAGNGTWLVAWNDSRTAPGSVYGACVSSAGVVQNSNGLMISPSSSSTTSLSPGVGWDGSNFLVAWQDKNILTGDYYTWAAHVSTDGGAH